MIGSGMGAFGIIVIYVVGMSLAVAEVFLPGVVMGIVGLGCVVSSIWLAFDDSAAFGFTLVAITALSTPLLIILWLKVLNRVMAMKGTQKGYSSANQDVKGLVGQEGVAVSQLRPAGAAQIGDMKVDVVADGELIERGTRVVVVEVKSNRVVVRPVAGAPRGPVPASR